ncbi:hypothetical protein MRX96_020624 [Rhipicephalus microplus]
MREPSIPRVAFLSRGTYSFALGARWCEAAGGVVKCLPRECQCRQEYVKIKKGKQKHQEPVDAYTEMHSETDLDGSHLGPIALVLGFRLTRFPFVVPAEPFPASMHRRP